METVDSNSDCSHSIVQGFMCSTSCLAPSASGPGARDTAARGKGAASTRGRAGALASASRPLAVLSLRPYSSLEDIPGIHYSLHRIAYHILDVNLTRHLQQSWPPCQSRPRAHSSPLSCPSLAHRSSPSSPPDQSSTASHPSPSCEPPSSPPPCFQFPVLSTRYGKEF